MSQGKDFDCLRARGSSFKRPVLARRPVALDDDGCLHRSRICGCKRNRHCIKVSRRSNFVDFVAAISADYESIRARALHRAGASGLGLHTQMGLTQAALCCLSGSAQLNAPRPFEVLGPVLKHWEAP